MMTCAFADTEFSKTLTPEEFSAAGLAKLNADELARLNALIEAQRSSSAEKARREAKGQRPVTEKEGGLLDRLRVVLAPGTAIEYATVETQLTGSFRGYEPGSVLTLANGQRWRVVEGSYWAPAKDANKVRKVEIVPGVLGSFFLRIDDGGRPKVTLVGPVAK
jgi:hypothetical protein